MLDDSLILNLYGKWVAAGENTNAKNSQRFRAWEMRSLAS